MKKISTVVFVILVFAFNLFAQSFTQWKPLERLVRESDLIVSGTLYSVSNYTKDNIDYSEGIIVIEEFISGNVKTTEDLPLKTGDKIKLTWQNPSTEIYERVELGGSEGNETIKILRVKSDGTVTVDNFFSMRAASIGQRREIRNILQKQKTRKNLRKVKLFNEAYVDLPKVKLFNETYSDINNQNRQIQNPNTIQNQITEVDKKAPSYSYPNALIIILFSISFYWILYRSRFKIR